MNKRFFRPVVLALLVFCCAIPASASEQPTARANELAAEIWAQENLYDTTMEQLAGSLVKQLQEQLQKQNMPAGEDIAKAFREEFGAAMTPRRENFSKALAPVLTRQFTEAELEALLAFYKTEHGRSVMKKMPRYMGEANSESIGWLQAVMPKVLDEVRAKLVERGIEMPK